MWAVVMLAGSALTAVYVFEVLGAALRRPRHERMPEARPVPWTMSAAALLLAGVTVILGHWAGGPLALLRATEGFPW
jgi:NADH:ubiquinone oxidoreductase subunit 5 (subunit L)/multisubunit Na+/H+ antiporter MnhA subunit